MQNFYRCLDIGLYRLGAWIDNLFYYPMLPDESNIGIFLLCVIPLFGVGIKIFAE